MHHDLQHKTAVVPGGYGVLGAAIAAALARAGAHVCIAGRSIEKAELVAETIAGEDKARASAHRMDVTAPEEVRACADSIAEQYGGIDILVNCVGGNTVEATTDPGRSFFDLPLDAFEDVLHVNFTRGVLLPCQEFGRYMLGRPDGASIVNIASMASIRPLTRVAGYNAAKAAVTNFTQWLAVHMAREHSPNLRVNAVAPGFFRTEQNRFLLEGASGDLSERGRRILEHTPAGRFGEPNDLAGAVIWLAGAGARFVTGVVIPVDGGFSAYAGV